MTQLTPRYLVSFHPKKIPHRFTDILIIGGGLAGLRAANAVPNHLSVMIVTKDAILQSSSNYAQGGIASVIDPEDRFEDHINDTLAAGGALCDQEIVDMVIRQAPDRIAELMQWGTRFDSQAGVLELGKEGGHSHHRVVHALGDATGREVMRAMVAWTQQSDNIQIMENSFTLDLLTHDGSCRGALIAQQDGQKLMVWAKQTILCTGGAGQLYRESTNPAVATADGHAAAVALQATDDNAHGTNRRGPDRCTCRLLHQNWRRNRASFSKSIRMSLMPYLSIAIRSIPRPKA